MGIRVNVLLKLPSIRNVEVLSGEQTIKNKLAQVANAIGASISQISGQYEQIYIYTKQSRDDSLKDAKEKATQQAILAGAVP
ncbi:hypothetical protein [Metaclostridioides mangenotii]|uniref:Uncharacterized protein n=1 Tax=Metaclostridioides mangenotii TaxID=1540 RepID=A0ABS4ECQ5_9FIRM|nr:hypothetical protein [Clostridioides mangenotii]MBP1855734.1 hypothetical protein [Clostridioides mangenotii]